MSERKQVLTGKVKIFSRIRIHVAIIESLAPTLFLELPRTAAVTGTYLIPKSTQHFADLVLKP